MSLAVERVLGYKPEERVGKSVFDFVHQDDIEQVSGALAALRGSGEASSSIELRLRHADGTWRCFEAVGNNLLDDPGVEGIVINSRDITERKVLEKKLRHQAFHDDLTGLLTVLCSRSISSML